MAVALVTGGAGFIGSHIAERLLDSHEVVILDDLSGGHKDNIPPGATFSYGDCTCQRTVDQLFARYRPALVWHAAAYAAEGLSPFIRYYNYKNNVLGSAALINASINHDVEHFTFLSSMAVYGDHGAPFSETGPVGPIDPYGIAKAAVERDLWVAGKMHGLSYTIFRPHNVYGERQNIGDGYRNVVGIFMNQAMSGEPLTIFGDGEQQRAFSYIGDVVGPMVEAYRTPGASQEVFNVGADIPYTVNVLADAVMGLTGAAEVVHLPRRHEVDVAYSAHAKLLDVFGVQRHTSLRDGLRSMWAWARERGPQAHQPFSGIEVRRGLPPTWDAV